jgi:hypothetical protein
MYEKSNDKKFSPFTKKSLKGNLMRSVPNRSNFSHRSQRDEWKKIIVIYCSRLILKEYFFLLAVIGW